MMDKCLICQKLMVRDNTRRGTRLDSRRVTDSRECSKVYVRCQRHINSLISSRRKTNCQSQT